MSESESPDASPRVLAEITDYAQMVTAFRTRAQARHIAITNPAVAEVAGLPDHYIAKLLAVNPVKRIGMISLGPLLAVLGCRLVLVEDQAALAAYAHRIPVRNEAFAHGGATTITLSRQFMRKIGRLGAQKRWQAERQRSAAASRAAKIRWANGKTNGHSK
jgi:hypothetical protein